MAGLFRRLFGHVGHSHRKNEAAKKAAENVAEKKVPASTVNVPAPRERKVDPPVIRRVQHHTPVVSKCTYGNGGVQVHLCLICFHCISTPWILDPLVLIFWVILLSVLSFFCHDTEICVSLWKGIDMVFREVASGWWWRHCRGIFEWSCSIRLWKPKSTGTIWIKQTANKTSHIERTCVHTWWQRASNCGDLRKVNMGVT